MWGSFSEVRHWWVHRAVHLPNHPHFHTHRTRKHTWNKLKQRQFMSWTSPSGIIRRRRGLTNIIHNEHHTFQTQISHNQQHSHQTTRTHRHYMMKYKRMNTNNSHQANQWSSWPPTTQHLSTATPPSLQYCHCYRYRYHHYCRPAGINSFSRDLRDKSPALLGFYWRLWLPLPADSAASQSPCLSSWVCPVPACSAPAPVWASSSSEWMMWREWSEVSSSNSRVMNEVNSAMEWSK